jgi:hypothetical protein
MGKDMAPIKASGTGNMKIRNASGKRIMRVIFFPKMKRAKPMTRKKIEKPEIEKT